MRDFIFAFYGNFYGQQGIIWQKSFFWHLSFFCKKMKPRTWKRKCFLSGEIFKLRNAIWVDKSTCLQDKENKGRINKKITWQHWSRKSSFLSKLMLWVWAPKTEHQNAKNIAPNYYQHFITWLVLGPPSLCENFIVNIVIILSHNNPLFLVQTTFM